MTTRVAAAVIGLVVAACGSSEPEPSTTSSIETPTTSADGTRPTASNLAEVVWFLGANGVTCSQFDVENEGPTAAPVGAYSRGMCYRDAAAPIEVLLYRSAADRAEKRPDMTQIDCSGSGQADLAGATLRVVAGANFDLRAARGIQLTRESLDTLNEETEALAELLDLPVENLTLDCS